jgi:DNA end-binding protein Ku
MARAVWSGSISFGLVNVPVKAFTAVHDHDIHFHQIDRDSGSRIGYEKVAKSTGEPVEAGDIELGYETSKGHYVRFDPDEIDRLRPASTRSLDVTDFVDLAAIDPVYFEHTYWLAPADDNAAHAYRLLAVAMEKAQKVGIGTVVMRNKQYLAAIRPLGGAMAMSTMRFADEVVDAADLDEIPSAGSEPAKKELALATQIIDALAADWDPEQYHDTFTEELKGLIEAKGRGEEIAVPEEPEAPAKVLDLLAALEASVADARSARSGSARSAASGRSAGPSRKGSRSAGSSRKGGRAASTRGKAAPTTTTGKKAAKKKADRTGRSRAAS